MVIGHESAGYALLGVRGFYRLVIKGAHPLESANNKMLAGRSWEWVKV